MASTRLLLLAGSARDGSLNLRLLHAAARLAEADGHAVETCDLRALALPLYDGDLEAKDGVPPDARTLQRAIAAADGVLIAGPEYNGFPTPLLINSFDWLSRLQPGDGLPAGLATTANKPVGLLAASPGPLGGLRSMNTLRAYLQMSFAMIVLPQQFALGRAHEAFADDGTLKDGRQAAAVGGVVQALARLAAALRTPPG